MDQSNECSKCHNPLRVKSGGFKSEVGSEKIQLVNTWACYNSECEMQDVEQNRTVTEIESFAE